MTSDFWRYISSLDSGSGSARLFTNLRKKLRKHTVATARNVFCGRGLLACDAWEPEGVVLETPHPAPYDRVIQRWHICAIRGGACAGSPEKRRSSTP